MKTFLIALCLSVTVALAGTRKVVNLEHGTDAAVEAEDGPIIETPVSVVPPEYPDGIVMKDGTNPVTVAVSGGEVIIFQGTDKLSAAAERQAIRDDLKANKAAITNTLVNIDTNTAFNAQQQKILKDIVQELRAVNRACLQSLKEPNQ